MVNSRNLAGPPPTKCAVVLLHFPSYSLSAHTTPQRKSIIAQLREDGMGGTRGGIRVYYLYLFDSVTLTKRLDCSRQRGDSAPKSLQRSIPPEGFHRLEQRRRHRPTSHRDT